MQIHEGPMTFEVHGLPTEKDVQDEFDKLKARMSGLRLSYELQQFIMSELVYQLTRKISISATYNGIK